MSDHKDFGTDIKHLSHYSHPHHHSPGEHGKCYRFFHHNEYCPHEVDLASHDYNDIHILPKAMPPKPLVTKVAIAGITGRLGRLIAKRLLKYEFVEVHGIARHPEKLPDGLKSQPRLKLFKSDLEYVDSLRDAVKGCSILISTILSNPGTEIATQKAMIDACVIEGVPRFMPNEFTFDWRTVNLDLIPMKKVNQEIYNYLDKQQGKVKGVSVLVGAFMETIFSIGYLFPPTQNPADGLSTWGTGNEIFELTSYDNAAGWAAAIALDSEATGYYRVLGDRLSAKEIAQTLQEVYDIPQIPFHSKGSLAELKQIVKKGVDENYESEAFWDWKGQSYTLFLLNGDGYLETPLQQQNFIDHVQQETLEDWLSDKKLEDLSKSMWIL